MGLFGWVFGRDGKKAVSKADDNAGVWDEGGMMLVNAYVSVRDLPALDFANELHNRRDLSDPAMAEHLHGLAGFVMRSFSGQMTANRYHLLQHVKRVRNQVSFSVSRDDIDGMVAWARGANAILFLPDGSIRAPDLTTILGAGGQVEDAANLPYPPDAVARKALTLERLAGMRPAPPASVPPSLGVDEVVLRSAPEVWRRALALYCVAAEGAAVGNGGESVLPALRLQYPVGIDSLTPGERAILEAPVRDVAMAISLSWRYEVLYVLLWALSAEADDLGLADRTVEIDSLVQRMKAIAQDNAESARLSLRPAAEILDALDLAWRQHWIVRQSALNGTEVTDFNPFIVEQRHLALNWLTGFQNDREAGWDDIDTPT